MASITNIPPNRAVALLTPTVFAPLAGALSVAAAKYLPGADVDAASLQAIFIAGATIAFGNSGIWLKGWQDQERRDGAAALATTADVELEHGDDVDLLEDLEIEDEAFEDDAFAEEPELELPEEDEDLDDELLALSAAHED